MFFFTNIATVLGAKTPQVKYDPILDIKWNLSNSVFLNAVTASEIVEVCRNHKDCLYWLNDIPTSILKLVVNSLCDPIAKIVKDSIQTGTFPDMLKTATCNPCA